MGKAIVIGIVILLALTILGIILLRVLRTNQQGDLDRADERKMAEMLGQAAAVLRGLGPQMGIEDSDFLSYASKEKVQKWLDDYNKLNKELDRA
jgi:hypothetical protein